MSKPNINLLIIETFGLCPFHFINISTNKSISLTTQVFLIVSELGYHQVAEKNTLKGNPHPGSCVGNHCQLQKRQKL